MSVVVKDMAMPMQCVGCEFCSMFGNAYISCNRRPDMGYYEPSGERPQWCPLTFARTGKWVEYYGSMNAPFWKQWECSLCGARADKSNYCPNCGAYMRTEDE